MNEDDTTSSSRIFIKILFQEVTEGMGLKKLAERFADPSLRNYLGNIFPMDNPKNTRFSINFFTSIGLGAVTEEMREHLKRAPAIIVRASLSPSPSVSTNATRRWSNAANSRTSPPTRIPPPRNPPSPPPLPPPPPPAPRARAPLASAAPRSAPAPPLAPAAHPGAVPPPPVGAPPVVVPPLPPTAVVPPLPAARLPCATRDTPIGGSTLLRLRKWIRDTRIGGSMSRGGRRGGRGCRCLSRGRRSGGGGGSRGGSG